MVLLAYTNLESIKLTLCSLSTIAADVYCFNHLHTDCFPVLQHSIPIVNKKVTLLSLQKKIYKHKNLFCHMDDQNRDQICIFT